jgi:anti-anti-sigma factor
MGSGSDGAPSFEIQPGSSVTVVRLSGDLDLAVREQLARTLADAAAPGPSELQIDLSRVTFLDSSGLHELLAARELGPEVVIVAPSPPVRRVFDLTAVTPLFRIIAEPDRA